MADNRPPSPFFALPDTHAEVNQKPPSLPPITVSCASCRTIVGDSSAFLSVTRELGGITLEKVVGVTLGETRSTTDEGVDRLCLYKPVECGECKVELGKMYIAASDTRLDSLRHKYTLQRSKLAFYQHGVGVPSLPPAESEEILRQIHPDPDEIAQNVERLTTFVMYMKEEQENIMIELQKLADNLKVEINLPRYVNVDGVIMVEENNAGGHIPTDSAIGSGDSGVGSRVFDQMRAMQEELETIKRQMREYEPGSQIGSDSRLMMRASDIHYDDSDGGTSPDPAHYSPSAAAQLRRSKSSYRGAPSTPQRPETPQTTAAFRPKKQSPRKPKTSSVTSLSKSGMPTSFSGFKKSSRTSDIPGDEKSRYKRRASNMDAEADDTEEDDRRDHADTEDNGKANSEDAENRPPPSFAKRHRGKSGEWGSDRANPSDSSVKDQARSSDTGKHRHKQPESTTDADIEARNAKKRRLMIGGTEAAENVRQEVSTQPTAFKPDDRDKERISRSTRASAAPIQSNSRSGQLNQTVAKSAIPSQDAKRKR